MTTAFAPLYNTWRWLLLFVCVGSLVWGALAAIYARKIRRFIAYTSINQMGFLLIGLTVGIGTKFTMLYLVIYTIMSLNFLSVYLRTNPTPTYLTELNAFHARNPIFGAIIAITFFAMAGIPPLIGFFGKYLLLLTAFQAKYFVLLKIALLVSMVSAFYYIRVVKILMFEHLRLPVIYTVQPALVLTLILNLLLWFGAALIDPALV